MQIAEWEKSIQARDFILSKIKQTPNIAFVLGSGLGEFADELDEMESLRFEEIPYFKKSTVVGHAGKLVFGKSNGIQIVCMQGRYHFYEGHTMAECVFPIRVFKQLGIEKLILTNAAGAVNRMIEQGDLMIIRDHINFMGTSPLIGPNDDRFGPRFPDQSNNYNKDVQEIIAESMRKLGISVKKGVYMAFTGPQYESAAEIRMASIMGADAVGMSTVPESIVANQMGIKVGGISCCTNYATGVTTNALCHSEVVETANRVKESFKQLLRIMIEKL